MMTLRIRRLARTALLSAAMLLVAASFAAAQPAPESAPPEDPLRRETPRGSFLGFVAAAEAGDLTVAGQYLQWPRPGLAITREEAARQLKFALNHGFEGSLDRLSRDPQGSYTDGQSADRERVGTIVLSDGERVDIFLARITPVNGPPVWLFSQDTVREVPRMYDASGMPEFERRLPRFLTDARFGELSLWVPLALVALLVVLYSLARGILLVTSGLIRLVARLRHHQAVSTRWKAWWALSRPSAFLLTVGLHRAIAPAIGIPLLYRFFYNRMSIVLLVAGLLWWLWCLIDLGAERIRERLAADHPRTAQSMYTFGRRILKGAALALAILIGLAAMGFNLTTTLAGLGIGGVALAFASQKTLENIFGGIAVLSDRSIVVGDFCKIGPHVGTVEDVGLRTTKLRTLNRTVVHVPNGSVAIVEVENFARRDKFFFNPTIGLRFETSLEQLQRVLADIRQMLAADTRVEPETMRTRFVRVGAYSLDVEVFAYLRAADYVAFLAIQEELLMRIMAIVRDAGTGLAFPSQTMYVTRDQGHGAPDKDPARRDT
ncbi:MAG: mechanosensitive ion channel family protein [Acidobacteria bacterium]|nr:mechanosensitive ion channel family protein [Acidobacteriota bacterium]